MGLPFEQLNLIESTPWSDCEHLKSLFGNKNYTKGIME